MLIISETILDSWKRFSQQSPIHFANVLTENKMLKLALILLYGIHFTAAKPINGTEYPTEGKFVQLGDGSYYIEQTLRLNWFQASNVCRQLEGFLLDLKNQTQLLEISSHLHPAHTYWISLNDLGEQGVYTSQVTGRSAEYLNWSTGQPDNTGGVEHCVELWRSTSSFQMNDVQCETKLFFACQIGQCKT